MKRAIFILLFFMAILGTMQAQKKNYIHISGDAGVVVNSERDEKFGLGGTLSWLTQDLLSHRWPGMLTGISTSRSIAIWVSAGKTVRS